MYVSNSLTESSVENSQNLQETLVGREQKDLVYGISLYRRKYLHGMKNEDRFYVDFYNNLYARKTAEEEMFCERITEENKIRDRKRKGQKNIENNTFEAEWVEKLFEETVDMKGMYSIKRRCKSAQTSVLERGGRIHFILDGLDESLDDIAKGKWINGYFMSRDKKNVHHFQSITASELRHLFRIHCKNPSLRKNIIFWKDGKQVDAPWKKNNPYWKEYKKKLNAKQTSLISAKNKVIITAKNFLNNIYNRLIATTQNPILDKVDGMWYFDAKKIL